jgi:glutamine synthetase
MATKTKKESVGTIADIYGSNVFNLKTMSKYLSAKTYASLRATIKEGRSIDPKIADEVADGMKKWALSKGATHFTHWFQPLTGTTAEKHDSFIDPDGEGGVVLKFKGKELIQGEPDASSFPSGGIRATFEARGYTVWDPTSPAFIKEGEHYTTLCIPTAFYSYTGDALDKKTPLLRSLQALSKQVCRLAELFGISAKDKKAYATLGPEQEYFLIDKSFHESRIDLLQTGRTLFGRKPAKHQQLEDHYFGAIKARIMGFMEDLDTELWKLGIPSKTRHNEVCPAQFEMAPVFEELNLAVDHNMMVMEVMRQVAERHDLVCLLHEKPFAGVNGSGKHNNWSIAGPDGKNWLTPGDNPRENAKFVTIICALMKAIDTHAGLLRAAVATAGNDHRLGANEAPPAILSIFLGEQLSEVIEQIEKGKSGEAKDAEFLELGVSSLPKLAKDVTDRNRTSPFAFTGNKFEFRAVGSNQNCSGANVVINTIVADALDEICAQLEADIKAKKNFNESLQKILQSIVKKHKRIIFNGDNYTEEWHKEAEKRGLPNLKNTPESLKEIIKEASVAVFEKHKVLTKRETHSRYDIYKEQYEKIVNIEANVALDMAKTLIMPAVYKYQNDLSKTIINSEKCSCPVTNAKELLAQVGKLAEDTLNGIKALDETLNGEPLEKLDAMLKLRASVDELEGLVPKEYWPLASYASMMFVI